MVPNSNASQIESTVLHLLHRARQGVDALIESECQRSVSGLTARQFIVLMALEANQLSNQTMLVELTGMDRSTLSDVIRRLQRKGLIQRKRSSQDRRAFSIKLSDSGYASLEAARAIATTATSRLLEALPANRRKLFVELLETMVERLSGSQA